MTNTVQIRTQRIIDNRKKLTNKCLAILKTSVGRIKRQGCGCSIDGVGAVYKNGKLRDAIAILLSPSEIYNHTYGEISEDDQKYIVKKIASMYSIRYDIAVEYAAFVSFLQSLQDAHDNAFDCFNHVEGDRMEYFLTECNKIKESLENAN